MTVLLVDDHDQLRALVGSLLEDWGYAVLVASCGDEALAASDRYAGPIHLLITDLSMPDMTGRELADVVRSRRHDLRVLFTSGYPKGTFGTARLEEVEAYLVKPFSSEELRWAMRMLLDATPGSPE